MRRAIVSGADGFLGRHLVPVLEHRGIEVTALTRRARPGSSAVVMGDAPWSPSRLVRTIEAVAPDVIFQLVGGADGTATELERGNIGVTTSIMQALRDLGVRPLLVCCGSAAEYGSAVVDGIPVEETAICVPLTPYGASKLAQTKAVLDFSRSIGAPVLIARIFNPIGPGMPPYLALGDFARQVVALPDGGLLQTGNIEVRRDFIDVQLVVDSLWTLVCNPNARGIVNICSGEPTRLGDLVELLIAASGKNIVVQPVAARMRSGDLKVMVGDTTLLSRFGAAIPRTNYMEMMARIWADARIRWGGMP